MMLNISGVNRIDDPEYRYKMPRLVGKVEGRGNGIKTVVVNCVEIATSLHRTAAEVCKFFGCELGAQSKYDDATERAVVNGAFTDVDMQSHLCKYIEQFVLCPKCRLPETKYKYRKDCVFHKCFACGADEPIDMTHKLTNFIVQQRKKSKKLASKDKDDKKDKKAKKKDKAEENDDEEKKKAKKDKKAKKKAKEEASEAPDVLVKEEEVEWHTDVSEAAVAARMEEAQVIEAAAEAALTEDALVATLDNCAIDDEEAIEAAACSLAIFLTTGSPSEVAILEEIKRQQTYAALPASQRIVVIFRTLFDSTICASSSTMETYATVLRSCAVTQMEQNVLLATVETFVTLKYPSLAPFFSVVLKMLYDCDILDEETLLAWRSERLVYASSALTQTHVMALTESMQPFIDWLEHAEDEEESDEE